MDFSKIIEIIKAQPLAFLLLAVALILYFIFDQKKYKNKKNAQDINKMSPEERAKYKQEQKDLKYKKTKNKKYNHKESYASTYDERHYESAPKDGTSLHQKGNSSISYKNKSKHSKSLERLPDYKHYLDDVREKNLNHLARNLEIINADCADDIYYLQKKGYFKNVEIDESNCRIFYKDQAFNSDFVSDDERKEFEDLNNNPYEILKTDFEGEHVPGVNITHICPHCGTPNIIDSDTKEYNCYYCLGKVLVGKTNKK